MRRRLEAGPEQRDFRVLEEFFAAGATDYFAQLFIFGERGDPSHGTGIVYSFTTDRRGGFDDDDTALLQATLPALSLAMKAHAGHVIASGLLQTYLGEEAGRRVHAGAIERGSVESIHAVLWYADIRGFTAASDGMPGPVDHRPSRQRVRDADRGAALARRRGAEISRRRHARDLPLRGGDRAETCRRALDAAAEAMQGLAALNAARVAAGQPVAAVDLALHVGEVLYGNVGAADRLDFTVIGPAVNEVARIEALCEPLDRALLDLRSNSPRRSKMATTAWSRSAHYHLRGVREPKEIFALA